MKTDQIITETLKVPHDILLDVLEIVIKERIKHEVRHVILNRAAIILELSFENSEIRKQKTLTVIQGILSEYNEYRNWQYEEVNWRQD